MNDRLGAIGHNLNFEIYPCTRKVKLHCTAVNINV